MNKIEFKVEDKDFYVTLPSARQEKDSMIIFAKTLTKAIQEGIISNDKLDKYCREQGMWDDEKEDIKVKLENEIRDGLFVLTKQGGIKKSEARKIAIDVKLKRWELVILTMDKMKLSSFTAESIAEKDKTDFLISCCTKSSDGTKAFSSQDDYQDKKDDELGLKAANAFYRLYHGLDDDFDKKLPENEFLVKYGFANENLELIDKDGNFVNIDGEKIKEPEKVEFKDFLDD